VERDHRLDFLRRPDAGLAWAAYRWAEGDDLSAVLDEGDLTAGDFVRWMKQLIDLSGQVADAAGGGALRETARDVVRRVRRGVVAAAPLED
jgi:ATP-dependent RNA helicase HelY